MLGAIGNYFRTVISKHPVLVTEKPPILDIESESPGDLDSQISAFSSEIDLTAKSVLVYIWTSTPGKGLKSYSYSWFTHNKIAII